MKAILVLIISVLLGSPAYADIDDVLERSGTLRMVDLLPEQFSQGFVQGLQQSGMGSELAEQAQQLVADSVDLPSAKANLRHALDNQLSADEVAALDAWYVTPLALRITELENEASDPAYMERIAASMDSLLANQDRMAQARRIEQALNATQQNMQMARSIQMAMIGAMMPEMEQTQQEAVLQQMDQAMESARPAMEQYILASIVGTYQKLSDEDLERYIGFLEQPATRKFYQVTQQTLSQDLSSMAQSLGAGLLQMLQEAMAAPAQSPS